MKSIVQYGLISLFLVFMFQPKAEIIFYKFDDPVKEAQFNRLITELRCPKCQNNNLADSNAPLSVDLKDIIYDKVNAGASDEEIIDFLKERYGDFIHYKPPVNSATWLLWFGPFVLLLVSAGFVMRYLQMAKAVKTSASEHSDEATLAKVQAWQEDADVQNNGSGEKNS